MYSMESTGFIDWKKFIDIVENWVKYS